MPVATYLIKEKLNNIRMQDEEELITEKEDEENLDEDLYGDEDEENLDEWGLEEGLEEEGYPEVE
jgi:hypothetical protein